MDIVMSQLDGCLQFGTHQSLCLFHLFFADGQCRQVNVIELQFIAFDSVVAPLLDIGEHRGHRIIEL